MGSATASAKNTSLVDALKQEVKQDHDDDMVDDDRFDLNVDRITRRYDGAERDIVQPDESEISVFLDQLSKGVKTERVQRQ